MQLTSLASFFPNPLVLVSIASNRLRWATRASNSFSTLVPYDMVFRLMAQSRGPMPLSLVHVFFEPPATEVACRVAVGEDDGLATVPVDQFVLAGIVEQRGVVAAGLEPETLRGSKTSL